MSEFLAYRLAYTLAFPEDLSADGAISINTYMTNLNGTRAMTLADGGTDHQAKLILTASGASATITCSLDSPNISFNLGATNKAFLVWHTADDVWKVIDHKGLTFNT